MPLVYLVRHAEAAAAWTDDPDPGLSVRGREQARSMAECLARLGPRPVVSSPLRRARETAAALEARTGMSVEISGVVGEIPTPDGYNVAGRGGWLRDLMDQSWVDQPPNLGSWRDRVLDVVTGFSTDTVVVTHYVAINAVVGAGDGDDRVVSFRPGNCSVTIVDCGESGLSVRERGIDPHHVTPEP